MSKENYKLVAVGIAAFVAMLAYNQGSDLVAFSGRPTEDQWTSIIAAIGAAFAAWKGWKGDGSGTPTIDVLQSLKTILEQFKTKGVPDEMSLIVKWGDEVYEADWKRRVKPEAK